MSDKRLEAAAKAVDENLWDRKPAPEGEYGSSIMQNDPVEIAKAVLDAVDQESRSYDELVAILIGEISHNVTPVIGRNRWYESKGMPLEDYRPAIEKAAKDILKVFGLVDKT